MFDLQLHNICVKDLVRAHVASPQSLASPDMAVVCGYTAATHKNLLFGFDMPAIVVAVIPIFIRMETQAECTHNGLNGISFLGCES